MTNANPTGPVLPESLSESLGFQETIVEVGMTHPAVRRVLSGVGGSIAFVASLDDERLTSVEVDVGFGSSIVSSVGAWRGSRVNASRG